jgi:protein-tyrosine phosphatase
VTRALDWDGCFNVRDLGGVALEPGGETRYGVLFRADNLGKLTADGWRAFEEHGVTRVVDLRWPEERAQDPPRVIDVEVVNISVFGEYDPEFDDGAADFLPQRDVTGFRARMYVTALATYRASFVEALAAMANADGLVVFHCAGGKDRTGLVASLLLRLAGATPAEIAADYALSEVNLLRGDEDDRLYFLRATPAEAMARTLDYVDRTYGSVEAYLRDGGLDEARLQRLKDRLAAP